MPLVFPADAIEINGTEYNLSGANPDIGGLGTVTAQAFEARDGVSPTEITVHSTYTSSTNYERLRIYTQTGGNHVIASEAGISGGTQRNIQIGSGLYFDVANDRIGLGTETPQYSTDVFGVASLPIVRLVAESVSDGDYSAIGFAVTNNKTIAFTTAEIRVFREGGGNETEFVFVHRQGSGALVESLRLTGDGGVESANGIGVWGVTAPAAQPATPTNQAEIISILQQYGLCA